MKLKETIHDQLPKQLANLGLVILLFIGAGSVIEVEWNDVIDNHSQAVVFLSGFLNPEWSYLPELIDPMIETLLMSLAGTFLGVILAIPAAFLGTQLVTRNRFLA